MHYQCIRTYCKDSGCSNTSHPFTLLQSVQPPDPHQLTNSANQNSDQLYSALLITSCFLDQVLLIVSKTPRVPSVSHHQDLEDQSSSHHKRIPPIDRRRLINPWKLSSPLYFHLCRPANVPINSATTSQHPMHFKLQKYHCSSSSPLPSGMHGYARILFGFYCQQLNQSRTPAAHSPLSGLSRPTKVIWD
jgi:hypothetical protein